jgi:hypothetical protein
MIKTMEWAESLGIDTMDILPPLEDENSDKPYKRTAREVAARVIVLHTIAAASYGIERENIVEWLKKENLWQYVSPREQDFLLSSKPGKLLARDRENTQWLQEAQCALLWTIQKVPSLGLPIGTCDNIKLVDEIMPELINEVDAFISSAELRPEPVLRAEEDRIAKLYDAARQTSQEGEMPEDLVYGVLFQRRYAFQWLCSGDEWDDIKTDIMT